MSANTNVTVRVETKAPLRLHKAALAGTGGFTREGTCLRVPEAPAKAEATAVTLNSR